MKASVPSRLSALLMFLLFVGGGPGISGLDTVLFHLNHANDLRIDHVEDTGRSCHAESCLLALVVGEGRVLPTSPAGTTLLQAPETPDPVVNPTTPVVFAPPIATLPRSPPTVTR